MVFGLSLLILFSPASAVSSAPPGTDIVVHLSLFAALALTSVLAGFSPQAAVLLWLGYAALSEVLQMTIPGLYRSGSVLDWLADAAGVLAGLLVAALFRRRGSSVA
ncbi:MAG: VanZ family protein [Geodermatophilaceae bacterium]|nr:VanZ family protein [Geodermatophilaceae bacterium]